MHGDNTFVQSLTDPPNKTRKQLQYFIEYITDNILETVVNETDTYSMQKSGKSMNTNKAEVLSLIGFKVIVVVFKLPSYKLYGEQSRNMTLLPL